jgi:hypothetical protein
MGSKDNLAVISVHGGCVEEVGFLDDKGNEIEREFDYMILDWDTLEGGDCPICGDQVKTIDEEIKEKRLIKTAVLEETIDTSLGYPIKIQEFSYDDDGNLRYKEEEVIFTSGGHLKCPTCGWDEKEHDDWHKAAKTYLEYWGKQDV